MESIILVSNTSWYLYNFRLSIIKLFQQQGYHVICIANRDDYSDKLVKEGVEFIQSEVDNKGTNPVNDFKYFLYLRKKYKKIKPVFIFHYTVKPNIYGGWAAKVAGIPSIAIVSGAGYAFLEKNLLHQIVKRCYRLAAWCCREMWFVNVDDLKMFLDAKIVPERKTKVLPGEGIDTDKFSRSTPYPVDNKDFIFMLSARLLWDKGVGVYVEAAREIKKTYNNVRFQLLGFIDNQNPSAISREQVTEWENEGVIEYLGVTDNVMQYLMRINCFVLPSYYREGVPRALLEAASLEIPIITTDNVGCREVVKEGYNGVLCRLKDPHDLAEKMAGFLQTDKQKLAVMGRNGRAKVIAELHEQMVLKFYREALEEIRQGIHH